MSVLKIPTARIFKPLLTPATRRVQSLDAPTQLADRIFRQALGPLKREADGRRDAFATRVVTTMNSKLKPPTAAAAGGAS